MMEPLVRTIRISDHTHRSIVDLAIYPFRETGVRQPDGDWLIPVSDETWERLEQHRQTGESDDDLLSRLLREQQGRRPD
jgi:hypothetical protein